MIFSLLFRIASSVVVYLYPGYKSYKTLSQRPANEADIERWLMYWSIIGCVVAIESAEWLINWLPLYYPIKAIFILYLVLPQTQGSSYIYTHQLQPFFQTYEPQIDATLSSFKTRLYAFVQDKLRGLWGNVAISMTQPAAANDLNEGLNDHAMNRGAPPTMQDPVSGPAGLMGSLLSSFGPNLLVQGMALMSSAQNVATTRTNEARRQNLETPGNSRLNTREGRGSDEPPSNGTGPFEEVDVPSDSEGDDGRPTQARSGSWFGRSSNTAGYERVKSD